MSHIEVIGILTVVFSYAIKVIGFPSQAIKVVKQKSSKDLSPLLFIIAFFSYCLWTLYGILKGDWVIVLGQSIGILASSALLILIFKYRKK